MSAEFASPDAGALADGITLVTHDAPAAPAAGPAGMSSSLLVVVAIFAIFYFLLIRPQQKEQQRHTELLSGLSKGDDVVTTSGLHGRIWEVQDQTVVIEIADKVRVTVDKVAVKRKMTAPTGKEG